MTRRTGPPPLRPLDCRPSRHTPGPAAERPAVRRPLDASASSSEVCRRFTPPTSNIEAATTGSRSEPLVSVFHTHGYPCQCNTDQR